MRVFSALLTHLLRKVEARRQAKLDRYTNLYTTHHVTHYRTKSGKCCE